MQICESSLIKLTGVIQMLCLWIKNLKKGQNNFKREKLYFLLLIGLINLSGFMWGLKSLHSEIILPNNISSSKNHDLTRNMFSNDLEEQFFHTKPDNRRSSLSFFRFSIEELQTYNDSSPILINGNNDFAVQASLNNWTGDGSVETPYLIHGLNITKNNEDLIKIYHTDVHFQISNCLVQNGVNGISFTNVTHGVINNTITSNNRELGINVYKSRNCTVSKHFSFKNSWGGISISSSNNSALIDINSTEGGSGISMTNVRNSILHNIHTYLNPGAGIYFSTSENANFSTILAENNENGGINIYNSNSSSFLGITATNNFGDGISIRNSHQCNLSSFSSLNNSGDGILISNSHQCYLSSITSNNNSWYGVKIESTDETSFKSGEICNNSDSGFYLFDSHHVDFADIIILNNSGSGLDVSSMVNGSFIDITMGNIGTGFDGNNIEGLIISNCSIYNFEGHGIALDSTHNSIITDNFIMDNTDKYDGNDYGILTQNSYNCTISNNIISRAGRGGIEIENCNKTVITFNAIQKNREFGIRIEQSSFRNTIANNIVYDNCYTAIEGYSYLDTFVSDNDKNIISENDFIANSQAEGSYQSMQYYSQADLRGPTFNVHHNYWDNINPLDEDEDGIVDNPYSLSEQMWGEEEIHLYDEYPQTEPTNQPWIHYLTTPILLYPRSMPEPDPYEVEIEWQQTRINGTIRMLWITPIDTENHEVTFSVYYSCNYGENWTEIISGIETSYYDWDTTTILDGEIILRVEALCTHGESTMDTDQREIRVDNSPPVLTDLQASPFSPIFYIMSGLTIAPVLKRLRTNKKDV